MFIFMSSTRSSGSWWQPMDDLIWTYICMIRIEKLDIAMYWKEGDQYFNPFSLALVTLMKIADKVENWNLATWNRIFLTMIGKTLVSIN